MEVLSAQGVRSPAKRRGSLRPAGSDWQLESRSYGFLWTSEEAHPLRQRMRKEQRQVYDAILSRADNETRRARVGQGKLVAITGLRKRSVRRAIKELVALGVLVKEPQWGKPRLRPDGTPEGGAGRRPRQLATEYVLPRLTASVGAGTLLGVEDGLDVEADPDDDVLEDEEALQAAARTLAGETLLAELRVQQGVLAQRALDLWELAPRVGQMLTGRGMAALIREAEERRIVAAVTAGKPQPVTPFPDTLRTRLEAVGGASCAGDRQRQRQPRAFQEALRARSRWSDTVYALLGAVAALDDVLSQIADDDPRDGDWRKVVGDARMALYLCGQVAVMDETITPLLEAAEASWAPLPKGPPPRSLLRLVSERPAVAPDIARYKPWAPPPLWAQRNGDSAARWLVGRRTWEQAKAAGNEKGMQRLRLAGFQEDWPDPPT